MHRFVISLHYSQSNSCLFGFTRHKNKIQFKYIRGPFYFMTEKCHLIIYLNSICASIMLKSRDNFLLILFVIYSHDTAMISRNTRTEIDELIVILCFDPNYVAQEIYAMLIVNTLPYPEVLEPLAVGWTVPFTC